MFRCRPRDIAFLDARCLSDQDINAPLSDDRREDFMFSLSEGLVNAIFSLASLANPVPNIYPDPFNVFFRENTAMHSNIA